MDIVGAVARGYCHGANAHKTVDLDLLNSILEELETEFRKFQDSPEMAELKKAIFCLYLAAPPPVVEDVSQKLAAVLGNLAPPELRKTLAERL